MLFADGSSLPHQTPSPSDFAGGLAHTGASLEEAFFILLVCLGLFAVAYVFRRKVR